MRTRFAIAIAVLAAGLLPTASASAADRYPKPRACGIGEPAYTGWNYFDLQSFGPKCPNAHRAAEAYVYDFSTEGVIDPPRHWDKCRDKKIEGGLFKGKCTREKNGKPQKVTFRFGGPDQPWYPD